MKFNRVPENFEEETWELQIVGYENGKAILKNQLGDLYYLECEEELVEVGWMYMGSVDEVEEIEILEPNEKEYIKSLYGDPEE